MMPTWLIITYFLLTLVNVFSTLAWSQSNNKTGWETIGFMIAMLMAWPLFAVRMLGLGYWTYLECDKW